MDAFDIGLVAIGVILAIALVGGGWWLDRRDERVRSAKWMRSWAIRNRVLADLWRRIHGPPRLQDRRGEDDEQP
jgi:hypothetical protein